MRQFVESLRRLYAEKHAIDKEYVNGLFVANKITEEEVQYILATD